MYFYTFLVACPFKLFTQSLYVRNHHENFPVVVMVVPIVVVAVGVLMVCRGGFIVVTVPVLEILMEFVECPGRKVAAV